MPEGLDYYLAATSRTSPYPRLVKLQHAAKETDSLPGGWRGEGRGHLHRKFTPSFKINKYFKTIIMVKKKQA